MASHTRSFFVLVLAVGFVLCVAGHGELSASSIVADFRFLFEAQRDFVETMRSKDGTGGADTLDRDRESVVGLWDAVEKIRSQGRGLLQRVGSVVVTGRRTLLSDDDGGEHGQENWARRKLLGDDDGGEHGQENWARRKLLVDDD